MLDSEHENPELIWNNDTRQRVARVVAEECNKLYAKQKVRKFIIIRVIRFLSVCLY